MNDSALKASAIASLVIQVLVPAYWMSALASFYYFWVEGVFEGGIFGSENAIGWGLLSVFCVVALYAAIKSLFLAKAAPGQALAGKGTFFFTMNIATIIVAGILITLNGGFVPHF